jgi:tetratricopeptide (TPR) repeat protein
MKKLIISLVIAITNLSATFCQTADKTSTSKSSSDSEEIIYQAYLSQKYEVTPWKEAIKICQGELYKNPKDIRAHYQLALAQFALISSTMRNRDEDLFDEYYDPLLDNLNKIIEEDKNWAEPYALKSAAYGVKMGYSPMQGMILGGKSNNLIEKAKHLDPNSALAWKVYANAKFFTPEMWGGDLDEAIASYEKAIQLYEQKPELLKHNWMYLDTMAFLGKALVKKGDRVKAIATYEKALKIEPEFGWVKFVLLPNAKSGK